MRVGWIGLGKLGLPCALVLAEHHEVVGYDVNPAVKRFVEGDREALRWVEPGVEELLGRTALKIADSVDEAVAQSDVVFVAVQTPHAKEYGGESPAPSDTQDFEYGYLVQAARDVVRVAAQRPDRDVVLVIVSTVLPGTTDRLLRPLLVGAPNVRLVYSPQFIAMGTTIRDFRNPEFLLMGSDDADAMQTVGEVFSSVHWAPAVTTTVVSAEAIKVLYNTFISMKIVWANHVAQICEGVGADADEVHKALSLAHERVVSPAYMRAGMGDGGACHPRDLIALADLERRLDAPPFFAWLAAMRDTQTRWIAETADRWARRTGMEVVVLGVTYKPNVTLTDGSPALLLTHYLRELGHDPRQFDPKLDGPVSTWMTWLARVYVVATNYEEFWTAPYSAGSVVIDPWGMVRDQPGVTLVRIGRKTWTG